MTDDVALPTTDLFAVDGRKIQIDGLPMDELERVAIEQEFAYAKLIRASAKGSAERQQAIVRGYDLICAAQMRMGRKTLGLHPRFIRMVKSLLASLVARQGSASFFEVGYGSGGMLAAVQASGIRIGGIEPSVQQQAYAKARLGAGVADLYGGSLLEAKIDAKYDLVYWNDVAEHIHPDEIDDYLSAILGLLKPGGRLITVSPNWHTRPWDVTRVTKGVRCEAEGFHLKEYTLREMRDLLRRAGFANISVPLFVTPGRAWFLRRGLISMKCFIEPVLEFMPYLLACRLCSVAGLSCTVAQRAA